MNDQSALAEVTPTRATWKSHGRPTQFTYFGRDALPVGEGEQITNVTTDGRGGFNLMQTGRTVDNFGAGVRFWAGN